MSRELKRFDGVLRRGGIQGVDDLVERWVRRSRKFRAATLPWSTQVQPGGGDFRTWRVRHGEGQFQIDGVPGEGRLRFLWDDWGERVLGEGTFEELAAKARELVRRGGPFGGPLQEGEVQWIDSGPLSRCARKRGEIRIDRTTPGVVTAIRVCPDGRFTFQLLTPDEPNLEELMSKLRKEDPVSLAIGGGRIPWCFADCTPIVGYVHAPPYELLLIVCSRERVAVFNLDDGALSGAHFMAPAELASFDAGRWLEDMPTMGRVMPGRRESVADGAGIDAGAAVTARPAAASGRRTRRSADRPRPERPLDDLVDRHFAHVAAQVPAGVLGAATAQELWAAIEKGYRRDLAAVSGARTEVFTRLFAAGLLRTMPGEHTGRAALQILTGLSPVVRKIHHRRWSLMFPELRDAKSEVIRAIREREGGAAG